MKKRVSSFAVLALIMLLIAAIHYKLHRTNKENNNNQNTEFQTSSGFVNDVQLFPSIFYRLVEFRR